MRENEDKRERSRGATRRTIKTKMRGKRVLLCRSTVSVVYVWGGACWLSILMTRSEIMKTKKKRNIYYCCIFLFVRTVCFHIRPSLKSTHSNVRQRGYKWRVHVLSLPLRKCWRCFQFCFPFSFSFFLLLFSLLFSSKVFMYFYYVA